MVSFNCQPDTALTPLLESLKRPVGWLWVIVLVALIDAGRPSVEVEGAFLRSWDEQK